MIQEGSKTEFSITRSSEIGWQESAKKKGTRRTCGTCRVNVANEGTMGIREIGTYLMVKLENSMKVPALNSYSISARVP